MVSKDTLVVRWFGGNNETMEMSFTINGGVPTISSISSQATDRSKHLLAENLVPEYRIVSELRRVTQQQEMGTSCSLGCCCQRRYAAAVGFVLVSGCGFTKNQQSGHYRFFDRRPHM